MPYRYPSDAKVAQPDVPYRYPSDAKVAQPDAMEFLLTVHGSNFPRIWEGHLESVVYRFMKMYIPFRGPFLRLSQSSCQILQEVDLPTCQNKGTDF